MARRLRSVACHILFRRLCLGCSQVLDRPGYKKWWARFSSSHRQLFVTPWLRRSRMFIDTVSNPVIALQRSAMFPAMNMRGRSGSAPLERGESFELAFYKHRVPTGRRSWVANPVKKRNCRIVTQRKLKPAHGLRAKSLPLPTIL